MNQEGRAGFPAPYITFSQFPFDGRSGHAALCDVRVFSAANIGAEFVTAVVTNGSGDEETSIAPVAAQIAGKLVESFEVEPTRLIYVEYFPAESAALIQDRLAVPAQPARFVRVKFDYSRDAGFTVTDKERIEITEVAYLTNTAVENWHREFDEIAACNRLFAMLAELGPARTFELIERAIQRHRERADAARKEGAAPTISPESWETLRQAVVQIVLCAETQVLPETDQI